MNGPIPDGALVLHSCDTRACFAIEHLRLGTHLDNMNDRRARGRARNGNTGKTVCKRGHPYTEENTIVTTTGARWCRACKRLRAAS